MTLTRREKMALLLVGYALLAWGCWHFIAEPARAERDALRAGCAAAEQQLQTLAAGQPAGTAGAELSERELLRRLPLGRETASLLLPLGAAVEAGGCRLLALELYDSDDPALTAAGWAALSLELEVAGDVAAVLALVRELERSPRLLALQSIEWSEQGTEPQARLRLGAWYGEVPVEQEEW